MEVEEADRRNLHIYMVRSNQIDTGTSLPLYRCPKRSWYFNGKEPEPEPEPEPELLDSFYSYVLSNDFYYYQDNFHQSLVDRSSVGEEEEREKKKKKTSPIFLPPDILIDIISRLPAMSILNLRSVSRDWNALSRDPHMLAVHITHAKRAHLAIHPGEGRQEVHLISTPDRPGAAASIVFRLKPLPKDIVVLGSINGILLLQEQLKDNVGGRLYLYNPLLSGDRLELPIDYGIWYTKCGFGFDQVRSEFKVLLIEEYIKVHGMKISIYACVVPMVGSSLGNPRPWTLIKEEIFDWDIKFCHLRDGPLALVKGKLHFLTHGNRIVAFDIVSYTITCLDFIHIPNTILRISELGDRLFAITGGLKRYNDSNIWVMKDYGYPESMTKEIVLYQQQCVDPHMIPYMLNEHEIFLRDSQEGVPYMVQHNPTLVMSPSVVGEIQ